MKLSAQDRAQSSQRVRVGMIGLAAVFLLIGLAAAIFSSANKEQPVTIAGAAQPDVVANMTATVNSTQAQQQAATAEPLSELGVTPSAPPDANQAAPADAPQ
jgi:hypothetical protein